MTQDNSADGTAPSPQTQTAFAAFPKVFAAPVHERRPIGSRPPWQDFRARLQNSSPTEQVNSGNSLRYRIELGRQHVLITLELNSPEVPKTNRTETGADAVPVPVPARGALGKATFSSTREGSQPELSWQALLDGKKLQNVTLSELDHAITFRVAASRPEFPEPHKAVLLAPRASLFLDLFATERCCFGPAGFTRQSPLRPGPDLEAWPTWKMLPNGNQIADLTCNNPDAVLFWMDPPLYIDPIQGLAGRLQTTLSPDLLDAWRAAPVIPATDMEKALKEWKAIPQTQQLPQPKVFPRSTATKSIKPRVHLELLSLPAKAQSQSDWMGHGKASYEIAHLARLQFQYDTVWIGARDPAKEIGVMKNGELRFIPRNERAEKLAIDTLRNLGFRAAGNAYPDIDAEDPISLYTLFAKAYWPNFLQEDAPRLRNMGWQIHVDASFHYTVAEEEAWYAAADPVEGEGEGEGSKMEWFQAEVGIVVHGERVNLLPILLKLLEEQGIAFLTPPPFTKRGDADTTANTIAVPMDNGRKLILDANRVRRLVLALRDMWDTESVDRSGNFRLSRLKAAELTELGGHRWFGNEDLRRLSEQLRNPERMPTVTSPASLKATLRPYQQVGLNWLQFLREQNLGGILADDMGLGKTIQTLAHLLVEKERRKGHEEPLLPSLIVAPTSLMTNWREEVERFAPELNTLVLHGPQRRELFDRIPSQDLVVTTYPLLVRDAEQLLEQRFHYIILDEAQYIKNPKTQFAQIASTLQGAHRLCLTGTPLENHLGELWSLFHFALPGFLGARDTFNTHFRRPIEKGGDTQRRELLSRRIAPLVLRRRKEEVASELPPKTEITQHIELVDDQRDLYESVRLAMHKKVQQQVKKQGFSRAHIVILDALLKLRQICCHPQLLKLQAAQEVQSSAKLDHLMELVESLLDEGRKILLFSQFTSMLSHIETRLTKSKVPYVILTGSTQDRATPIQSFQSGKVPLFLISLKAGGTGLNLTAADTVIHYDPWWNPAVENQATDRAHRIGQDKPVFVYRLIATGTVEDKILELQERKRNLIQDILTNSTSNSAVFSEQDIAALFSPLD